MLNLIKIFEGSFGGATLYENPDYITPNAVSDFFYTYILSLSLSLSLSHTHTHSHIHIHSVLPRTSLRRSGREELLTTSMV